MNTQMIIGRLGRDADFKYVGTGGNNPVAKFSVATTERWKTRDGQKQEKTQWFNVVLWGKLAEAIHPYLLKGTQVYVSGKTESREYEDNDGNKKYFWEIIAREVELLGSRGEGGGGRPGDQGTDQGDMESEFTEDDIPF